LTIPEFQPGIAQPFAQPHSNYLIPGPQVCGAASLFCHKKTQHLEQCSLRYLQVH